MLIRLIFISILLFATRANAQACPGADDEPALSVKSAAGITLLVCGREDREEESSRSKVAFESFSVYAWAPGGKESRKLYSSESSETHFFSVIPDKGFLVEEMWELIDKPQPFYQREVSCSGPTLADCQITASKCALKIKKNAYPLALKKLRGKGKLAGDEAEDLIDQILVQALTGDKSAAQFFAEVPTSMSADLKETFEENKKRLQEARKLNCLPGNA